MLVGQQRAQQTPRAPTCTRAGRAYVGRAAANRSSGQLVCGDAAQRQGCLPDRLARLPARLAPAAPSSGGRATRRQQSAYAPHFMRLLGNQGSWEAAGRHTTAGGAAPYMPPPAEAWEGLGQHAPELAELACSAADVASSLQYFEVRSPSRPALPCFAGLVSYRGFRHAAWSASMLGVLGRVCHAGPLLEPGVACIQGHTGDLLCPTPTCREMRRLERQVAMRQMQWPVSLPCWPRQRRL